MDKHRAKYILQGFHPDGLEVMNLRAGRITTLVMQEALQRCNLVMSMQESRTLADTLNDMMEAAKLLPE